MSQEPELKMWREPEIGPDLPIDQSEVFNMLPLNPVMKQRLYEQIMLEYNRKKAAEAHAAREESIEQEA